MGSFTFCLVRTAPINATIIINHQGSVLRAATPGRLDGVGRAYSAREHHPHSLIKPASSSLWRLLEQSGGAWGMLFFFEVPGQHSWGMRMGEICSTAVLGELDEGGATFRARLLTGPLTSPSSPAASRSLGISSLRTFAQAKPHASKIFPSSMN